MPKEKKVLQTVAGEMKGDDRKPIEERCRALEGQNRELRDSLEKLSVELAAQQENLSQIRQAQRRFDRAAAGARCVIYDRNLVENKIEQSSGLHNLLGWREGEIEVTDRWWFEQVHPEDRPLVEQELKQALQKADEFTYGYRIRHRLGHYLHVRERGQVIRDEQGEAVRVYGITQDVTERNRAREALLRSREQLRTVADRAPVFIAQCDREKRYTFVNRSYAERFGLSPDELIGKRIADIIGEPACRNISSYIQIVLSGRTVEFEVEMPYEKIGNRFMHCHYVPEYNSRGVVKGWIAVITDITGRRMAERELERANERFTLAEAAANGFVYDWDFTTGRVERSPGFNRVTGYAVDEVPPTNEWWRSQVHADDLESIIRDVDAAFEEGKDSCSTEYRVRHNAGHYISVWDRGMIIRDADGRRVRIVGSTVDVTDRKHAEEALRVSEERSRVTIEAAHLGIWDWDIVNNRSTWGGYHGQLFGYPDKTSVTYEEFIEMVHPEDRELVDRAALKSLEGEGEFNVIFRMIRPDGSVRWMRDQGWTYRDERRRAYRMIGVVQDITDIKHAEVDREQLLTREKQLREAAEAANRAKDEFIAVVTHELRSPLNAIFGWAQTLLREVDEETRAHAVQAIERNARAQSKLIEDLLDNSRILSGKLRLEVQPISLVSVISNAMDVVRPAADAKNITIKTELDTVTNTISGDPERLQQVFWNLLSNAIKFTNPRGQVTIRLERVDPHVRIIVSDTGRGIKHEHLPYIFNRFHQADESGTRRRAGLGLGLSLARHLVELHGGIIEASSDGEGRGANFTVSLPVRAVRAEPDTQREGRTRRRKALTAPGTLKGLKALIVDDESDARELLTTLLKQFGAEVMAAASAAEALDIIAACGPGELPDVLVSDIGMPEADGYSLIQRVRQLPPQEGGAIPAVALTAFSRAQDRIRALSSGFQMHVPKPVEQAELVMVIAALTGRTSIETGLE